MSRSEELRRNLEGVQDRIASAISAAGATQEVTLVAVSKTYPVEDIRVLYELGHRDFGENYVQEWREKSEELPGDIRWHFIGGLQSNKAKYLADRVHLVHSLDSLSAAKALGKRSSSTPNVLIQVNTGNDLAKGGVDPSDVMSFLREISDLVHVRGLMTIPPFDVDPTPYFEDMQALFLECQQASAPGKEMNLLSMGMTSDFEIAIAHGATHIRVGTAIFGARG